MRDMDDLRGQLDAQGREVEKFKLLLQEKKERLQWNGDLVVFGAELKEAKKENLQSMKDVELLTEKNRVLEADHAHFIHETIASAKKIEEQGAIITGLRQEIESLKAEATNAGQRLAQFEVERASEQEVLRVAQEKVKNRAKANEELRVELEISTNALKTLRQNASELSAQLQQILAKREQARVDVDIAKARSVLKMEHIKWNSWRLTLEEAQAELDGIAAEIEEAKSIEDSALRALLRDSLEDDPEDSCSVGSESSLED
ncbi:uncharacterized protein LOC132620072 [Lycium barbarum]|uniref:uncharacterized protein LOC132620072 n=1 Tax=Lycium barbarum TaxID=112863 RepID=UPI00293F3E71|nr:uncharacterized protein LOC132620072 [Lycium barbarum]